MNLHIPKQEIDELKSKVDFYLNVQRYDSAEKLLQTFIVKHGPVANVHNLLGLTYHQQSKFKEAIEQFKTASKINPKFIEATVNLAATYCDLGQYELAKSTYQEMSQFLDSKTSLPTLTMGRLANKHAENGKLYEKSQLFEDAIREYSKALDLFENMSDVRLSLAQIYLRIGHTEKAKQQLEIILDFDPNWDDAKNLLGLVYYQLGLNDLAIKEWSAVIESHSDNLTARTFLKIARIPASG